MDARYYFCAIDKILPRSVARRPYVQCLNYLQAKLRAISNSIEVWDRNSIKLNTFVFGVSDLDVTIYVPTPDVFEEKLSQIKGTLKQAKALYPFLGETNFYVDSLARRFSHTANPYELMRDPILIERLGTLQHLNSMSKAAFLLRMLYADKRALKLYPEPRQRKWRSHLAATFPQRVQTSPISIESLCSLLTELFPHTPDVKSSFDAIRNQSYTEENIFHLPMPWTWKFLFPHRYLWFFSPHDEMEARALANTEMALICLEQIKWEIWGLMGQMPFISDKLHGFSEHLGRLQKLALTLDPKSHLAQDIEELIAVNGAVSNLRNEC